MIELTDHNDRLRERAIKSIHPTELGIITMCAGRSYGDNRRLQLQALCATASEFAAREDVVCAAFGFLPALSAPWGTRADVLNDPTAIGVIDQSDQALQAAWALCRIAADRHGLGRVCIKVDALQEAAQYATRLLKCFRANRAARGPMRESFRLTRLARELQQQLK